MKKKKLSISIMAHPSREKYFGYLKEKLGDVPFSIDGSGSIWNNRKRAMMMYDENAQFHLVLQDDAIIGNDFIRRAEQILNDDNIVYSFYFGNRRNMKKIADKGMANGFVISDWLTWGLAICIPTKIIEDVIENCDRMHIKNDDTRIARYLRKRGIRIYYTMPSLIDHRADIKSLVNDSIGRKARYFIGE
ncbi:MAG: hypothetical protein PHN89_00500 [Candidatus Pacebacteria bacterium]|nr:hypothetical protein [Candidatus Paceibacterota bacterium]